MCSGNVRALVRDAQGRIMVVVDFGGFLGIGSRPIAVPVDAMVLLGQDMEIVAFTPKQLRQFPTFSPAGTTELAMTWLSKSVSRSLRTDVKCGSRYPKRAPPLHVSLCVGRGGGSCFMMIQISTFSP